MIQIQTPSLHPNLDQLLVFEAPNVAEGGDLLPMLPF